MRTILYIIAAFLILVAIPAVSYVAYLKYAPKETSTETPMEQVMSREEVINGIANFLKRSQDSDGNFVARYKCEFGQCTPMTGSLDSPVGWSILGLLAGASTSGEPELEIAADKAMDRVLRLCENDHRICAVNFQAITSYYDMTRDPLYETAIQRAGDSIRENISNEPEDLVLRSDMRVYINLEKLYEYYQDPNDRNEIISAADLALKQWPAAFSEEPLYTQDGYPVGYIMPYVAGSIFLPAYRVSGDEQYLNAAREFFSNAAIEKNLMAFRWEGGLAALFNSMEGLVALSAMEEIPQEERDQYADAARIIMRQFIEFQYDLPKRPVLDGGHGLRTGRQSVDELLGINYKHVNINGWTAHLLAKESFADMNFTLLPYSE